jgi:5-methylcytosine-specific restriction endonuclease McrA
LRQLTRRWAPISSVKTKARTRRGFYECAICKEEVPYTTKDGRKRVQNVVVDHIEPIVNPETGFTTWDDVINRMFCEEDNLQVVCKQCHDEKSAEEKRIASERGKNEQ